MINPGDNILIRLGIAGMDAQKRYYAGQINIADRVLSFTDDSFADSDFTPGFNGTYGSLTADPDKVIEGPYSAYGESSQNTDWYEFLYSDLNKIKLAAGASYRITFKYRAIEEPAADGAYYFLARSLTGGIAHDKSMTLWQESADGTIREKTIEVRLDDCDDYYLVWGLHYGGAISVNKISVIKIDGGSGENFESDTFDNTKYYGYGITNSTKKVIRGNYSAEGYSDPSTEWFEFLATDPQKAPLMANASYAVTFSYKVYEQPETGGNFYFLARTAQGGVDNDIAFTYFNAPDGTVFTKTLIFTLNNYSDYYLIWGTNWGGGITIDDVKITRLTDCEYEKDIAGVYNVAAIQNGQFLCSDSDKINLSANALYAITFLYKPLSETGPGGYYYLNLTSASANTAVARWYDPYKTNLDSPSMENIRKTFVFQTGVDTAYQLTFGVCNYGGIAIDNVTITKL